MIKCQEEMEQVQEEWVREQEEVWEAELAQDKAEDAAEWTAHVLEQVQAETAFAQAAEQKFRIKQDPHVTMSTVLNAGQKWLEDR